VKVISPNIPLEKLDALFLSELEEDSDSMIEIITDLIEKPLEKNVENAEFLVFVPQFVDEGSHSVQFYLDGKNKLVGSDKPGLYAGNSLRFYENFDLSNFSENDEERFDKYNYPDKIADIIMRWFAECWWKAGGWKYPVPVTIASRSVFGSIEPIRLTRLQKS